MLPDAAAAHYLQQQRLTVATLGLTRSAWARMTTDFDLAWRTVGPRLALVALSAQLGAARAAEPYLAAVLPQVDLDDDPAGAIVPESFVGAAGDGRPVETLLYGAVVSAKEAVARGDAAPAALAVGGRWLDMAVHTLVADTSRAAVGVGVAARPAVGGYVRMLNLPSCSRCVVLAGKWFGWNAGFPRHPRCDCRHVPSSESVAGDLTVDARKAIESGRVTDLSEADRKAIVDDGADVGQVINARRGMYQADVLGHDVKATRVKATAGAPRLRPETIYREASDRDDAIRLLKRFGYIT